MPSERTGTETQAQRGRVGIGLIAGLAVAALLLAALDLLYPRHPHFRLEGLAGFYALCGALACLLGVALALLLRRLAVRPEDDG